MSIQTINLITNKTVKSFKEMTEKAVDTKVAKAQEAFTIWKDISYQDRADLLHKVATLMRLKKSELAKTITLEMGNSSHRRKEKLTLVLISLIIMPIMEKGFLPIKFSILNLERPSFATVPLAYC